MNMRRCLTLLLCLLITLTHASDSADDTPISSLQVQQQEYNDLIDAITPKESLNPAAYNAVQRWTRLIPYGIGASGAAYLGTKLAVNNGRLDGPQDLIAPAVLAAGGLASGIVRAALLRAWQYRDMKRYQKRLRKYLKKWPEKREGVPVAVRGILDAQYRDIQDDPDYRIKPVHAKAIYAALEHAMPVMDGVNELQEAEVVMPDDEHADVVATPKSRVAQYKKLYKASRPKKKISKKQYNIVSGLSALVPVGIGAAGAAAAFQAKRNNSSFLPALGLALGAGGAAVLRTFLLRKWLNSGMQHYHKALGKFLKQWPEKREAAPLALRATIDALYDDVQTAPNGINSLAPAQMYALNNAMHTIAVVDAAAHVPLSQEYEKWQFVLEGTGLAQKTPGYFKPWISRMPKWFMEQVGIIPIALISAFYLTFRVPALRAYMNGFTGAAMFEDPDEFEPTQAQHDAARNGMVAKVLGWPNYDSHNARFDRVGPAIMATVGVIPLFKWFISSGLAMRKARQQVNAQFDQFVSVWPLVKHAVPIALHSRFEELYSLNFDATKNRITLPDKERTQFISDLKRDAQPWQTLIKARGKKSDKGEKYLKRKQQGSWWSRLFKRKKKQPKKPKNSAKTKNMLEW